jgi:hypothetical protein
MAWWSVSVQRCRKVVGGGMELFSVDCYDLVSDMSLLREGANQDSGLASLALITFAVVLPLCALDSPICVRKNALVLCGGARHLNT